LARLPILVINLARQPERLARMERQFRALGLTFERLDAVDRKTAPADLFDRNFAKGGPLGAVGSGDMACTLSHRKAWRRALELDAPATLILEDDVELSEALPALVANGDWLPASARFVKLDRMGTETRKILLGRKLSTPIPGRELRRLYSRHLGGAGYVVTRAGAAAAVEASEIFSMPVDHFLFDPDISDFAVRSEPLQLVPVLVRQARDAVESDIQGTRRLVGAGAGRIARQWRKVRATLRRAPHAVAGARRMSAPFL